MSDLDELFTQGGEGREMTESLKTHPAPGWFSFIEIPGSEVKAEIEQPPEAITRMLAEKMGVEPEQLVALATESQPGIMAALVVEVGTPKGVEWPHEWGSGDTVYLMSDRGIPIGDYRFAMHDKVISYKLAGES